MQSADINFSLIQAYLDLLKNLSNNSKPELIARLSESMQSSQTQRIGTLGALYGAFVSEQSADELISDLKQSRKFPINRVEW